MIYSKAIKN